MQRTIKVLRVALLIALVAFIVYIVRNWSTRVRPPKEGVVPITSTQRPDDKPQVEAKAFEDTQTVAGRVVSRIRADRVVAFTSGWNTLEGVQLTIYRPNGLTYELVCPQAQFNATTKEADAKGGVKLTSTDGIIISTAEIKFDGNRLTNRIPVEFQIDRWKGRGGALDLDVQAETLRLSQNVTATMTPATAAEAPLTLAGEESLFRRRENDVTFERRVKVTRAADQMTCDRVLGRLTTDRKHLVSLEGAGNVVMIMSQLLTPGEDLGGRKQVNCDRFFTEVTGDGQITAINAVGDASLARAVIDGPPKRDLIARSFRIALQNRAVSEMKANGEVVLKEFADVVREIRGENMLVSFDSVRHRAVSAFIEPFRYSDPKSSATAFRAHYDIAGDRLLLTADPGFGPTVISDGQTIKARQIEFSPRGQVAIAKGEVIAQLVSKGGGATADQTTLFPSGKPVFINADNLVMRQATKIASFSGNVKAWQETNTIFAADMQVEGPGNTITARGGVRGVLYETGEHRKIPLGIRSDQLVARKNERRLDLIGNVKIDDLDRTVTSEKATVFFNAAKKLERIDAEEKVVFAEKSTGRRTSGDKAIYMVARRTVNVTGTPAVVNGPQGEVKAGEFAIDIARNRVEIVSPTGPTQGTIKHVPGS